MKYKFTAAYAIRGITLSPLEPEKLIVSDESIRLRAILTNQPDSHLFQFDRALSVGGLLLKGFTGQRVPADQSSDDFRGQGDSIGAKKEI